MTTLQRLLAIAAATACLAGLFVDYAATEGAPIGFFEFPLVLAFLVAGVLSLARFVLRLHPLADAALAVLGAAGLLHSLATIEAAGPGFWLVLAAGWVFAWLFAERHSATIADRTASGRFGFLVPLMFGGAIIVGWEAITRGGGVSPVLLPAPSSIGMAAVESAPLLAADFVQTFVRAVLVGYAIGCGAAFLIAIAIDRSPFLKRGLLPLGNFVSALPLVGIAPIMVMWFGFGWESKAAVVVVMTFFPMLVNTIAGLNAAGRMQRDLMRTYAASYWQTLFKLRLPEAAPFIFNALKINSTLALIGAIVAEFFGSPVVGMGFRMSSEIGKLNLDLAWAEIGLAAVAGSLFYWVVALVERSITFWHPSVRRGRA